MQHFRLGVIDEGLRILRVDEGLSGRTPMPDNTLRNEVELVGCGQQIADEAGYFAFV